MAVIEWLKGKKTYLIMLGGLITVLVSFLNGDLSVGEAITAGLGALGLGSLRAGISKGN